MSVAPGPGYAAAAYKACLYGRADKNQQQSAAYQISGLHGLKGELIDSLKEVKELLRFALLSTTPEIAEGAMGFIRNAEAIIVKAEAPQ